MVHRRSQLPQAAREASELTGATMFFYAPNGTLALFLKAALAPELYGTRRRDREILTFTFYGSATASPTCRFKPSQNDRDPLRSTPCLEAFDAADRPRIKSHHAGPASCGCILPIWKEWSGLPQGRARHRRCGPSPSRFTPTAATRRTFRRHRDCSPLLRRAVCHNRRRRHRRRS